MLLIYSILFNSSKKKKHILTCPKFTSEFNKISFHSHSLPWDQTTPIGYCGEICFSILNIEVFWAVGAQVLLLFIFLCKNNFAFCAMFESFVNEFHKMKDMRKKHDAIRKLVNFHNNVKRYNDHIEITF